MRAISGVVLLSVTACLLLAGSFTGHGASAPETISSSALGKASARMVKPQPEPPKFRVMTVQQLKSARRQATQVRITGPGETTPSALAIAGVRMQRVEPGAGCPAYASGQGVVLRPVQPWHEASGSTLVLRGVFWNERVRRQVASGDIDASFALAVKSERTLGATAYFQSLPSALHTYMLTIGTSAERNRVSLRIGNYMSQLTALVANPETSEIRALFTYEAGRHDNRLAVYVHYFPSGESEDHVYFHHLQLAQLD